jgi:N-methylhydantoinase B
MTNLMVGGLTGEGKAWAFYETIGCGSGARPLKDGVDGVHTNMTNTLNTPIEIMERSYPLLFKEYRLREDSEGAGKYRGGLGIVRSFTITNGKATVTVLSERCHLSPWGLFGGQNAAPSSHYIVRSNGKRYPVPCKATLSLEPGDTLVIRTPGGGGYGDPCERDPSLVERDLRDRKISAERARVVYCYRGG